MRFYSKEGSVPGGSGRVDVGIRMMIEHMVREILSDHAASGDDWPGVIKVRLAVREAVDEDEFAAVIRADADDSAIGES